MSEGSGSEGMTFWDHLDVLRGVLLRIAAVVVVFGMVAFFFKEELFDVVLAPKDAGFITYRWLERMAEKFHGDFSDYLLFCLFN